MSFELTKWALKVKGISPTEKLVLAQLCAYANEEGMCFPRQGRIADDCGLSRQSVNNSIKKLKNIGVILAKKEGEYLITPVNVVDRSVNVVDTPPVNVVDTPVKEIDTPVNVVDSHLNKPINKPINKPKSEENRFDEFYKRYPRKKKPDVARRTYNSILKKFTHEQIMTGLEKSIADWNTAKTELQFIPYPSSYLNSGDWKVEAGEDIPPPQEINLQVLERVFSKTQQSNWQQEWFGISYDQARQLVGKKKYEAA